MPQIRLIPSTIYNAAGTDYLTITDSSNAYNNTDSTTRAIIQNINASTTSRYIYLRGFNFGDVPSNAIVNSITIKLKASHSGGNTSTIYCYNGTSQVSTAGSTTALGNSATVKTFTNTTIDWNTLKGYGSNFGIRINCRRNRSNTTGYVYIYGAEILVDYTIPVTTYTVSVSSTDQTLTASVNDQGTSKDITAGQPAVIFIDGSDFTGLHATDNGVDVTSSLVYVDSENPPYYTYNIAAVNEAHTIVISRVYSVTASTSVSGWQVIVVNGNFQQTSQIEAGDTAYVLIGGGDDYTGIRVTDNGVDVTSSLQYDDSGNNPIYIYQIDNVQAAHTIVVTQVTTYSVTASTSVSGVTLTLYDDYGNASGTSMSVTAGDGGALVVAASDYSGIHLTDNGVDVTSSLLSYNNNTKRYSFSNIQATHTLVVTRATTYSVTASTSVSGWQVTVLNSNNQQTTQIEAGDTAYVAIMGNDYTGLRVTDNGVDVTSSLVSIELGNSSYYGHQITNVQEAHVIVVSQVSVSTYNISASTSASGLTLTLSSGGNSGNPLTVNEGSTVILTISGSDLTNLSITDNGTDATSSLVSNNGVTTYTISNVQTAHTLVVSQTITPSTYTVRLVASEYTADSNYVTVTNENYLYENTDNTSGYATVRGRNASNTFSTDYFFLHGFNFSAVPENAIVSSFTVKIKGYRNSYNTSSYNYLRKSPSTSAGAFSNSFQFSTSQQTLTIPTGDTTWQQLVNCDDFTIQLCLNYNTNNSSAYGCVNIYGAEIEVTYTLPYTISASSEVARATIQPESLVVRPGGKSAKFILNTNRGIVLKDNGVDVTSQISQELDPGYSYSVTNITDPWGFFLNDDDYYESNIQNEANGSACCRFDFHLAATGNISFSVINYAESSDYGIFYKLDTTASTYPNTDVSGSKVYWTGNGNNSASVQTVTYTGVSAGDHYIYIKYRKSSSTNQYNDSLQFKVASVTITGSYTPGNIYTYTINPVQANHTLVVEQGIMVYDISATSSSSGLTLLITDTTTSATGNPLTITEGHTARLSISSNDLTDLTIMDNETDVTSSLVTVSGGKQYTITNVHADHTIVIYQSFRISASIWRKGN